MTHTKDEALRIALEALEYHQEQTRPIGKTQIAIATLREIIDGSKIADCECSQGQVCHVCDPVEQPSVLLTDEQRLGIHKTGHPNTVESIDSELFGLDDEHYYS